MLHATTLPSGRVEHFDKRICLGVSVPNLVQCKHISSSLPCANQWAGRVQHENTSLRCSSVEALGFSRRVLHELCIDSAPLCPRGSFSPFSALSTQHSALSTQHWSCGT